METGKEPKEDISLLSMRQQPGLSFQNSSSITNSNDFDTVTSSSLLTRDRITSDESTLQVSSSDQSQQMEACVRKYGSPPPNYFGLALCVSICNCPMGVVAIVFSLLSKSDFLRGDLDSSKVKGKVAKWLSISGFAVFFVVVLFIIIYQFVILPNTIDHLDFR